MSYMQAITACLCLLLMSILSMTMGGIAQDSGTGLNDKYLNKISSSLSMEIIGKYSGHGTITVQKVYSAQITTIEEIPYPAKPSIPKIVKETVESQGPELDGLVRAEEEFKLALLKMNNNSTVGHNVIPGEERAY